MLSSLKLFKKVKTSDLSPIRTIDFLFRWNQNKVNLVVCQYGLFPFSRDILLPTEDLTIERDVFLSPVAHYKREKEKLSDLPDRTSVSSFFQTAEKNFQEMSRAGKDYSVHANSLKLDRKRKSDLLGAISDNSFLSFVEMGDFFIEGTEEIIGQFEDLIIDDQDWSLQYMVVDTEPGRYQKLVAFPYHKVSQINWVSGVINVNLSDHRAKDVVGYPNEFLSKKDREIYVSDSVGFP